MSELTRACRPLLAWARLGVDVVELACAEHAAPGHGARGAAVVRLPGCLADVGPHLPLELLVLGVPRVVLRLDGCGRAALARSVHAGAAAFTRVAGVGEVALAEAATGSRRREVLDAAHMPVSRRRALLLLPLDGLPELPSDATTDHQRLRAAVLALLDRTVGDSRELLAGIPGPGRALVADGCAAAGTCVRSCPEVALSLVPGRTDGSVTLTFDPGRCSGCGLCLERCDRRALSAAGPTTWADLVMAATRTLAHVRVSRCERCGAGFAPRDGEHLCPVCSHRRTHPFGSALPAAVLATLPADIATRLAGVGDPPTAP